MNTQVNINAAFFSIAFRIGFGLTLGAGLGVIAYCSILEIATWLAT